MVTEHPARITWSAEQVRLGLLAGLRTTDPAWVAEVVPRHADAWSLVCEFEVPPREQGNPSSARVRFLFPDAPHDYLRPGARLQLFEPATGQVAQVEILA